MSNQEPEKKSSISDKILKKQIALRNSSLNKILPLKIMYILAATFICIALLLGYKPFVRYGEYSSIYGEVFLL